jgi:hypothetical protein
VSLEGGLLGYEVVVHLHLDPARLKSLRIRVRVRVRVRKISSCLDINIIEA